MSEIQEKILKFLRDNPSSTLRGVAKEIALTHTTVGYHIGQLALQGKLKKVPGKYEVTE